MTWVLIVLAVLVVIVGIWLVVTYNGFVKLRNIVEEVYRRWERPRGNAALRAEVSFLILRDGTVREIRLARGSGSFSFDLSAQGAVEAAGSNKAFGPLPDGYPADVLPVSFYFTPRTQ